MHHHGHGCDSAGTVVHGHTIIPTVVISCLHGTGLPLSLLSVQMLYTGTEDRVRTVDPTMKNLSLGKGLIRVSATDSETSGGYAYHPFGIPVVPDV